MSVTNVTRDLEALTLTVTAEWDAPVERIWQLWADPRQLERWWGPPGYPATVTAFDLRPDGLVRYHMTSPEGEQYHGAWRVQKVDPPHLLVLEDSFTDEDGTVVEDLPTSSMEARIEDVGNGRTRMVILSRFPSTEAMEQVIEMGVEEGIKGAVDQIDAILGEDA